MSDIPVSEQRVSDERLDELIMATDMRGRYEPAEYCKRIDVDTVAALRELLRLRTAQPKGESGVTINEDGVSVRIALDSLAARLGSLKHKLRMISDVELIERAQAALRAPSPSAVATSSGEEACPECFDNGEDCDACQCEHCVKLEKCRICNGRFGVGA